MNGMFRTPVVAIGLLCLAASAAWAGEGNDRSRMRLIFQEVEPPTLAPPPAPSAPAVPPPTFRLLPPTETAVESDNDGEGAPCPSPEEMQAGLRPIGELSANILPAAGEMPMNCSQQVFGPRSEADLGDITTRMWVSSAYLWEAPGLCHRPLYFEEPSLERHGQSLCPPLQPVISGAHFLAVVPSMPYRMVAEGSRQCTYTLGHYRPGSPAPAMHYGLPKRLDATVVQGAAVTGLIFLIP
jgi:hypothetical protein